MKLFQVVTPLPCDILDCDNTDAVLVVRTDEEDYAVCPECVGYMSDMNNENEEFFAQVAVPGYVRQEGVVNHDHH